MIILLKATALCLGSLAIVSCSSGKAMQKAANEPIWKVFSNMAMVGDATIDSAGGEILMKGDVVIPKDSKNGHIDIQIERPAKPIYRTSTELMYRAGVERGPFAGRKRTYALKLPETLGHDTIVKIAFHDTGNTNNWERCREPISD